MTQQNPPEQNPSGRMGRREFLERGALAALPLTIAAPMLTTNAAGQPQQPSRVGLIMRQRDPENLEFPLATLDTFLTPNDRFYVRSHFAVPTLDTNTWRLKVEGAVERTLELTYADLQKMPSRTLATTLECAGNGRVFLTPAATGVQWENGAVSTAEWTGVSLASVLERAGVRPNAVEVILEGADGGEIRTPPRPAGTIRFARSLSLAKAKQPDTLLALKMNGSDLPPAHGFPLRAVVPGWYGMASIKWLTRIVVTEKPFQGYYQTVDYAIWETRDGLPNRTPLREMQVKAVLARPTLHEVLPINAPTRLFGAAWTGEDAQISRVEVSTDGGKTWANARLLGEPKQYCWQFWELIWQPPRAGRHTLLVRATDSRGRTQPTQRDASRENYMINHILPIEIEAK